MRTFSGHPEPRRVSPGEYPWWDRALALLNRDLAVTLPQRKPLQLMIDPDQPEHVYVAMDNGEWHATYLLPDSTDEPASVLATVAEAAQDTVTECLWLARPLCPEHGLGMHLRDANGRLSWWCAGDRQGGDGHVLGDVGLLDMVVPAPRPEGKRNRAD
ncbi:hypothetical protein OIE69_05780 [Actinacidiphila glaucinigra]|nr:hypothetical protein OIE69_05780 [Actinacidiphila glaucinigra]